ncbi:putative transport protein [Salmonella enterica subsp. enterica]|nr:putative transport protein [Salmonella enterica subsp. enterica]
MKQQAGIGILLALTTAMCWGALPIAMKQVLEVMEPSTIVFYRFLMASIGLGAILAVKRKLPPLRIFRKPRWLVLLAIATCGLFGNFILFSSSLQYLSPTASQVIGQLSPVGMMVASVFILKEKMRGTQVIGALMLLSGLVMFFNTSLIEIFTRLTDYTWGVIFGVGAAMVWVSYGVAQKSIIATSGLAADPVFTVHFMYDSVLAAGKTDGDSATERLAARLFDFLRAKYAGRIWRPGGSDGALAGGAGERDNHAYTAIYPAVFRSFIYGLARFLRQTDVKPFRLSRCVCRGCGRDVFRHWSSYLGRFTQA